MITHMRKRNGDTKCGAERKAFSNVWSTTNAAGVTCKRCLASKPDKPATVKPEPTTPAQKIRALLVEHDYPLCIVRATPKGTVTVQTPVMAAHIWIPEITALLADFDGVKVK